MVKGGQAERHYMCRGAVSSLLFLPSLPPSHLEDLQGPRDDAGLSLLPQVVSHVQALEGEAQPLCKDLVLLIPAAGGGHTIAKRRQGEGMSMRRRRAL